MRARRLPTLLLLSIGLVTFSVGLAAEEMPVAPEVQASLFKRILDSDRTLKSSAEARVLVLHEVKFQTAEAVVRAFAPSGSSPSPCRRAISTAMVDQGNVVYLTPEAKASFVAGLCAEQRILTVSGLPAFAETCEVPIGIGGKGDAPEIVVHLGRVKTEQHEFSSELLSLARVIR